MSIASVAPPPVPRITRLDGLEDACEHAERLRTALEEIAVGDDSVQALDARDGALRELWRLGASSTALVTLTGMSATAIQEVVRATRSDGHGHRTRITALLLALAELP
jgi:hypothetical protein